jgi:hypothetical protein
MRVVLSVAAGKISSVTLLRRLSTYSRRNNFYKAFREVGRVIRTIQLLRYLSDPQLRRRTTAATNKVESYNNFSAWCRFGNEGRVRDNDPAEQEKQVKFSTLLTNAVIFHTTLDMMAVLRQLAADGWEIKPEDLAVLSPYLTMRINRFGVYATDEISVMPEEYDARLPGIDLAVEPVPRSGEELLHRAAPLSEPDWLGRAVSADCAGRGTTHAGGTEYPVGQARSRVAGSAHDQ